MIKLENVVKDYINKEQVTHALQGVNLTIDEGEFIAIVGTSGSGKSTLLNIIGGMDNVTSGKYIFKGKEIDNTNLNAMHRELQIFIKNFHQGSQADNSNVLLLQELLWLILRYC